MHVASAVGASEKNWSFYFFKICKLMTRKHENVSAEYCPKMTISIETTGLPLSRNRNLGTSQNKSKENFPLLTNGVRRITIRVSLKNGSIFTVHNALLKSYVLLVLNFGQKRSESSFSHSNLTRFFCEKFLCHGGGPKFARGVKMYPDRSSPHPFKSKLNYCFVY